MPAWQKVRSGILLLFLAVCLILANLAMSAEISFTPSLNIKEEYTDNLFFDRTNKKDQFISTFSPGFEVETKTERGAFNLLGVIDRRVYKQNPEFNDWNYFWDGKINYQLTPRLSTFTEARYRKNSSPDQFLDLTGVEFNTTQPTYTNDYSFGGEYYLSEKTVADLSYGLVRVTYDNPDNMDYVGNMVNLSLTHNLEEFFSSTIGRMNLGYSHYSLNDPGTSLYEFTPKIDFYRPRNTMINNYTCTIGARHALSEKWSVSLDAGPRYTTSEFDTNTIVFPFVTNIKRKTTKDWGPGGHLALTYNREKTSARLTASQEVSPAGASYGATERTNVSVSVSQRFTDKLLGKVSVNYFLNQADAQQFSGSKRSLDKKTYTISPAIRYDFNDDLGVEFNYKFSRVKDQEANTTRDRNLCFFNLVYKHPFFE